MIITMNSHILGAVQAACGVSDTRWYLNGWHLDLTNPEAPLVVGTNGHVLLTAPVEIAKYEGPSPTLPKGKDIFKPLPIGRYKTDKKVVIDTEAGTAVCGKKEMKLETIDGTYPDWRRVTAMAERGLTQPCQRDHIALNPNLLGKIVTALSWGDEGPVCRIDFGTKKSGTARVKFEGSSRAEELKELHCILMLCHTD